MTSTPRDPLDSLHELERSSYRMSFVDGFADLSLGGWLIVFGLLMRTDYAWAAGILAGLILPTWRILHRRYALPRIGRVRFGEERRTRQARRLLGLRLLFVATTVAGVAVLLWVRQRNGAGEEALGLGAAPFCGAIAIILGLLATLFDFRRLYLHATILLTLSVGGQLLEVWPPYYVLASGALILLVGIVVQTRFLRAFPIADALPDAP